MIISIVLFALMIVATLFWGSNLGWGQVLVFWGVFLVGGLIISNGFDSPGIATAFKGIVAMWFAAKAATTGSSALS